MSVRDKGDEQWDKNSGFRQILIEELRVAANDLTSFSAVLDTAIPSTSPRCMLLCICIERCLNHGLKEGGFLSGDKQLFDLVQTGTRRPSNRSNNLWLAHDLAVVSDLPLSKPGKARAWLRHGLNQRHLDENIIVLAENIKVIRNFYEPYAIMAVKSATAQVAGILEKLKGVKFDIKIRDRNLDNHKLWETVPDVFRATNKLIPNERRSTSFHDRAPASSSAAGASASSSAYNRRKFSRDSEGYAARSTSSGGGSKSDRTARRKKRKSGKKAPAVPRIIEPSSPMPDESRLQSQSVVDFSSRHSVDDTPRRHTAAHARGAPPRTVHGSLDLLDEEAAGGETSSTVTSSRSTRTKTSSSSGGGGGANGIPSSTDAGHPSYVNVPNASSSTRSSASGAQPNGTPPDDVRSSSDSVSSQMSQRSAERAPASPPAESPRAHKDSMSEKKPVNQADVADMLSQIQEKTAIYSSSQQSPANRTTTPSVSMPRPSTGGGTRPAPLDVKRNSTGGVGVTPTNLASPPQDGLDARQAEISALKEQLLRMEAELLRNKIAKAEEALKNERSPTSAAAATTPANGVNAAEAAAPNFERPVSMPIPHNNDAAAAETAHSPHDGAASLSNGGSGAAAVTIPRAKSAVIGAAPSVSSSVPSVASGAAARVPQNPRGPSSSAASMPATSAASTDDGRPGEASRRKSGPASSRRTPNRTPKTSVSSEKTVTLSEAIVDLATVTEEPNRPLMQLTFEKVNVVSRFGRSHKRDVTLVKDGIEHHKGDKTTSFHPYKDIVLMKMKRFDCVVVTFSLDKKRDLTYKSRRAPEIAKAVADRLARVNALPEVEGRRRFSSSNISATGPSGGPEWASQRDAGGRVGGDEVFTDDERSHSSATGSHARDGPPTEQLASYIKPMAFHHPGMREYDRYLEEEESNFSAQVYPGHPGLAPDRAKDLRKLARSASLEITKAEAKEMGPLRGIEGQLHHHQIESYFEVDSQIRDNEKQRRDMIARERIRNEIRNLKNKERARRRQGIKHRGTLNLDLVEKTLNRSQMDVQGHRCFECTHDITVTGSRYCEYTGKLYCQKCHYGESMFIPAKIVDRLDVGRYLVCKTAKTKLERTYELPEIPRTMIQSSLYFSSKPLNRFGHLQLQLQAMAPFIEQCTQKMELFELLGTRQYLLYEPDVLSIRDFVEILGDDNILNVQLADAISKLERHITCDCTVCVERGTYCEFCKDPQRIYPFQIPFVVRCPSCKTQFHTKCFDSTACPVCARQGGGNPSPTPTSPRVSASPPPSL